MELVGSAFGDYIDSIGVIAKVDINAGRLKPKFLDRRRRLDVSRHLIEAI